VESQNVQPQIEREFNKKRSKMKTFKQLLESKGKAVSLSVIEKFLKNDFAKGDVGDGDTYKFKDVIADPAKFNFQFMEWNNSEDNKNSRFAMLSIQFNKAGTTKFDFITSFDCNIAKIKVAAKILVAHGFNQKEADGFYSVGRSK